MSSTADDDLFLQIMEGVELSEPLDATDYTLLDDADLARAHSDVRTKLFKMGELHNFSPVGEAADLHAQFAAINVEMRRRWRTE